MATIEKSIDVDVPLSTAYHRWMQFEDFPQFMEHVVEVRRLDDTHLHWVAEMGGAREEWDAEVVEREPDRLISWRSVSGAQNAGRVEFLPTDGSATRVTLRMEYEPDGIKESIGSMLGLDSRHVEHDLQRFKELVEGHSSAMGAGGSTMADRTRPGGVADVPTDEIPTGLGTGTMGATTLGAPGMAGSGLGSTIRDDEELMAPGESAGLTGGTTPSMPGTELPDEPIRDRPVRDERP